MTAKDGPRPSVIPRRRAHAGRHMHAGRLLQDGAAALPRRHAIADIGADAVGAAVDVELGIRRFRAGAARSRARITSEPLGSLDGAPGIEAAARRVRRRSDAPSCRRCRPARVPPRSTCRPAPCRALISWSGTAHRRRLGDRDRRRQDARRRIGQELGIDGPLRRAVVAGRRQGQDGFDDGPIAHVERPDPQHKDEKEQDMQHRHQHRGGGTRQSFSTLFFRPQRAGSGTQEWVRQGNFAGQTL